MISLQAAMAAAALAGAGQTVLLDFYSDTCGPCRAMERTIQALIDEGYPVEKVNVAEDPALAAKYRVRSIPCYVMLADGQEIDRVVGGTTFSRLKRMFRPASPVRSRPEASAGPAVPAPGKSIPATVPRSAQPVSLPARESGPFRSGHGAGQLPAEPPGRMRGGTPSGERPPASPAWSPAADSAAGSDARWIAPSVRLRIKDADGRSCGSGTIIDAREGEALILTCGHIFRDSQGRGPIEVDLFGPTPAEGIPGRLICYDLKRDMGLVSIRTPGPVAAARVAPPEYRVRQGDPVVSVGCDNGGDPTAKQSRVTSLDKFELPPNLQVAGQPVVGRSGGGLFCEEGWVIGVCNAADPTDREGLFAAVASIHAVLDRAGLSHVYRQPPTELMPRGELVSVDPPAMPKRMPRFAQGPAPDAPAQAADAAAGPGWGPLPAAEQAAWEEICRKLEEGAEVICVVRSRQDPQAKSEIIMLDRVSADFVKRLAMAAGAKRSHELIETSRKPQAAAETSRVFDGWHAPLPARSAKAPGRPPECIRTCPTSGRRSLAWQRSASGR